MPRRPLAALALFLTSSACRGPEGDLPPEYRRLAVPEARLRSPEARDHGSALYRRHCALCHGVRADGRGARREGLSSKPRDFTDPAWRGKASPRRVFFAIREGVPGTAMPSWKLLDEGETWDVVAFVLGVGETAGSGGPARKGERGDRPPASRRKGSGAPSGDSRSSLLVRH